MVMPSAEAASVRLGEPRSRTELILEMIALRHQIAVLKRSGPRRPRFGLWDRLFWILLSWWWPRWPESLMVIQPETVKRWRRDGWSSLWRYRAGRRWRCSRILFLVIMLAAFRPQRHRADFLPEPLDVGE